MLKKHKTKGYISLPSDLFDAVLKFLWETTKGSAPAHIWKHRSFYYEGIKVKRLEATSKEHYL